MRCREIIELLPAHLDEELPSSEDSVVRAHLVYCPACRAEQQRLSTSWEMLVSLPAIKSSADFRARFWERIREEEVEANPWWARILAPKLIPTACVLSLWLFGVSTGAALFNSKLTPSNQQRTKEYSPFAETYPVGSFSQLILDEGHDR